MNILKSLSGLAVVTVGLMSASALANLQSWQGFTESEKGTLVETLVYPTGFTVEAGTKFQLLQNYELEGLGVQFMLLQADHCSDISHIEEMMIVQPEAAVGLTWDPGCQMEVFIETSDLQSKSIFNP